MSYWWPITSVGASNVRRSSRCGAVRPKNRPWMTAALGSGSWRIQSTQDVDLPRQPPRRAPAAPSRATSRAAGAPKRQRDHQRREGDRAADQRVVEHRHLDHHAAQALGRQRGDLERVLAPSDVPSTTASSTSEVVEQRDHLRAERRHRVAPLVGRAVGLAVAEQVERDARGGRARPAPGRAPRACAAEQQAVQEHDDARALAVVAVGQPAPGVAEAPVAASHAAAF